MDKKVKNLIPKHMQMEYEAYRMPEIKPENRAVGDQLANGRDNEAVTEDECKAY